MSSQRPLHILLADDQPSVTQSLSFVLRHAGHFTESTLDGAAALEKLRAANARFDLLITDHSMPVMDGQTLVASLRASALPCRVIVLSANLDKATIQGYRELGVTEFFDKPFDVSALRDAVARHAAEQG